MKKKWNVRDKPQERPRSAQSPDRARPPQSPDRSRAPQSPDRARPPHSNEPRQTGPRATIYGVLPVLEALRANARKIDKIVVADGVRENRLQDIFELARTNGIRVDRVRREALEKLVDPGVTHQGVVAFSAAAEYVSLDEILAVSGDQPKLLVLLDGVEDPRNLGAVLRAVECSGADGVVIPERRAVGLTETAVKASAGATEYVKVAKERNLNQVIEELKKRDVWIVGTSGDAETDYTEWDWNRPTALVLGAEGSGLHRLVAENCDLLVKIPMYGKIDSLNVSVAAGVILFEARRQRSKKD